MTAKGELYVDEMCRDVFRKELNKWFGKDKWRLDGSEFSNVWKLTQLPNIMRITVRDLDNNILGSVEIENEFIICDNGEEKYIDVEPMSLQRIT